MVIDIQFQWTVFYRGNSTFEYRELSWRLYQSGRRIMVGPYLDAGRSFKCTYRRHWCLLENIVLVLKYRDFDKISMLDCELEKLTMSRADTNLSSTLTGHHPTRSAHSRKVEILISHCSREKANCLPLLQMQ